MSKKNLLKEVLLFNWWCGTIDCHKGIMAFGIGDDVSIKKLKKYAKRVSIEDNIITLNFGDGNFKKIKEFLENISSNVKIREGLAKKPIEKSIKVLILLYGVFCLIFGFFILSVIFIQPNVGFSEALYLFTFVVVIIGIAGIVKGIVIKEFMLRFRNLNIIIGNITVFFALLALIFSEVGFIFHVFTLIILLFLNFIIRAGMYLGEYGLSLKKIRNLKVMFYIFNDYTEPEIIRKIVLSKIARNE